MVNWKGFLLVWLTRSTWPRPESIPKTNATSRSPTWPRSAVAYVCTCDWPASPNELSSRERRQPSQLSLLKRNPLHKHSGTIVFIMPRRVEWYTFCLRKVKFQVAFRSRSGHGWTGQYLDLGWSCCISLDLATHSEHIGAFSDALAQFSQEILTKN